MRVRDYFPLGLAEGEAFCNREQETRILVDNICNVKHSLIVATRKYGKSSLSLHAIHQSKIPYVEIDFYMARNEKIIELYILNAVIELIGKTLGPIDKLISSIKKYSKHLKPKIEIGEIIKLELTTDLASDPATNVKEALLMLDRLLEEKGKIAILWLDEFQTVGVISKGLGIEAAIRHVAQKTKNLIFIFSGSNRRMLLTMFEDDTRPLYKLCWKIELNRISAVHYQHHLQKAAKLAWKKHLEQEVIDRILFLSERHPFYLNKLCDRVWTLFNQTLPQAANINQVWQDILEEEKSDAIKEISLLSLNQKSLLVYIAKGLTATLTGKQTLMELEMSSSSVIVALEGLEEKDTIEKTGHGYRIINPVIKFYALKNENSGALCGTKIR